MRQLVQRSNSTGSPTSSCAATGGYFQGVIDEARIWNVARSREQIRADINSQLYSGTGLVARWGVGEGIGTTTNSSVGNFPGTLTVNTMWTTPGAPFNIDITPPGAPTGLTATGVLGAVNLAWTAPADTDIAGYNIYRGTTIGGEGSIPINSSLVTGVTYSDNTGVTGTPYYYVVKTVDTSGNSSPASSEVTGTPLADTTPPATPTGLSATPGNAFITLTWTANVEGDMAGYNIYRSEAPGVPLTGPINDGTLVTGTTYNDTERTNGIPYYYVITAVDTHLNQSGASNEVNATPAEVNTALEFNGATQYVAFGIASGLGVQTFTIECWFNWTGGGTTANTGSGGVTAIPLITKGLHESDGSTVDANYFLGITTAGKLVADFEEYGGGQNYPVTGNTTITTGSWHHVAITYDGQTWKIYLDGNLDTSLTLAAPHIPRYDSIQKAGLGAAMDSGSIVEGRFAGKIDEARIWDYARSQSEIRATINSEVTSGTGLIARWGMNEGTGTIINSSVGTFPGTLTVSPTWVTPGAPFNIIFDTTPPAAPILLTASGANTMITLDWADNTEPDLAGYNVYRGTVSGVYTKVNLSLIVLSARIDTGLDNGTEYYYVVRAVDTSGNESTNSNEANAIPQVEAGSALEFTTNTGTYVTFGDPAKLDLATFTIETWFKRTGDGTSITTGTNGIPNAIPLVTHGAQQAEGTSVDANWVLVIDDSTDVIAADFEDMATGLNHPVLGVTPITNNVWHHAAATFDGTSWRLYLDGKLETTLSVAGFVPRSDTTQYAGLGSMLNTLRWN